jgi:hypothetical protein
LGIPVSTWLRVILTILFSALFLGVDAFLRWRASRAGKRSMHRCPACGVLYVGAGGECAGCERRARSDRRVLPTMLRRAGITVHAAPCVGGSVVVAQDGDASARFYFDEQGELARMCLEGARAYGDVGDDADP